MCATELVRALGLPLSLILIARRRASGFVALELAGNGFQLLTAWLLLPRLGVIALPVAALGENLLYGLGAWRMCKADLP
jgi:hypothetical protein